jgi:sugar lactone lactonase YvrE
MNRPFTFIISVVLLLLLAVTALVTLIAYSPTYNRPSPRMLSMMEIPGTALPTRDVWKVLGATRANGAVPLLHPHGLAVERSLTPDVLWVADSDNHRVAGYLLTDGTDSQSAPDFVLGITGEKRAGRSGLNEPMALAVDKEGGLYIADLGNNRVVYYRQPFLDEPVATWMFGQDDWEASVADAPSAMRLNMPRGVTLDEEGNLYIADSGNHRILRVPGGAHGDGVPDRVWGQGGAFDRGETNAGGEVSARSLSFPAGIAMGANGLMAVADAGNHRVLLFDTRSDEDAAIAVLGQGGDFESAAANRADAERNALNSPEAVEFGPGGLYVADTGNHRVLHYSSAADDIPDAVWQGDGDEQITPTGLSIDSRGSLMIADRERGLVLIHRR